MLNKLKPFFVDKKIQLLACPFIAILFVLDIWTKRLAFSMVDYIYNKTAGIHTYLYVNDYFNIVKVINNGVSFGMFRNLQQAQIILSFITFCIILFVIYLLFTTKSKYKIVSYALIIAGGFGNIYDRIFYGGVFDFLDFHLGKYHWPAFNIADSLICIGVFLLLFEGLFYKTKKN